MKEWISYLYLLASLLINSGTYLLTMKYLFRIPFRREKKRWIICLLSLVVIHVLIKCVGGVELSSSLSVLTFCISFLVLLRERKLRIIVLHLTAYLAYSSFTGIMITMISFVRKVEEKKLLEDNWSSLLVDSLPLVLLFIYHFSRKKEKTEADFTLQPQQIIFMLAGSAGVYWVEGSMQIMGRSIGQDTFLYVTRIIVTAVGLLFLLLILWQGIVVNRQNRMAEQMRLSNLFERMREEHLKEFLAKDEEMRRFRHDYRAHMMALKGYSERGEHKELADYLKSLLETGDCLTTRTYMGDAGVDAVINTLGERARREGFTVTIDGRCRRPERVTSFELCCIFSNILTNAIEACERVANDSKKEITLQMRDYNDSLFIRLTNSSPANQPEDNTWKKDKQNHGLGMGNVRRIVEKCDGRISVVEKDGTYITEIVL